MDALREIGLGKAVKFAASIAQMVPFRRLLVPPARASYLRLMGAHVGEGTVIHDCDFFNLYRTGFPGLRIGDRCFIGDGCLFDLADRIEFADQVTLAERVTILTHINVGYADHPLQRHFPSDAGPVILERGCFVGVNSTILHGVRIGECAFVAAGSLVRADVPARHVVGGVPARVLRVLDSDEQPPLQAVKSAAKR